jgi:hypothetical protein
MPKRARQVITATPEKTLPIAVACATTAVVEREEPKGSMLKPVAGSERALRIFPADELGIAFGPALAPLQVREPTTILLLLAALPLLVWGA